MKIPLSKKLVFLSLFLLQGCLTNSTTDDKNNKAANVNAQLGALYLKKNQLELANHKLSKALRQDPNSSKVHHVYALLQERLGDDKKAAEHFQQAIRLKDNSPELHNNYGSYLCRTRQIIAAEKEFLTALQYPLYKTPEFAYTNAGICVMNNGELKKANGYFRQALKANSRFPSVLYQLSRLNFKQKHYNRAEAFLQRYNEVARETPESLYLCAKIAKQLKDSQRDKECFSRLVEKFPHSPEIAKLDAF